MAARPVDRRRFLQGAGALVLTPALAQLLAACGDPGDKRLSFWNWQDYIDPKILDLFKASSGIATSYSTYASNDELEDRLTLASVARKGGRKATSVDLIVPSDNLFRRLKDGDQLQELDTDVVTTKLLGNLTPELRKAQPDPGGAVRSSELTLPGFTHDRFSAFYPLAVASPAIVPSTSGEIFLLSFT